MATFRTKDAMDAARFVRNLQGRGYVVRRGATKPGGIPRDTYQVSRKADVISVSYYEPGAERNGKKRGPCTVEGCERIQHARGLCNRHYVQWLRETNPTKREHDRQRAREWRARQRAIREEAA